MNPRIFELDPASMADADLSALVAVQRDLDRERAPLDPELPLAVYERRLRLVGGDMRRRRWLARDDSGSAIAVAVLEVPLADNTHAAFPWIGVRREARRRGLARSLLRRLVAHARDVEGRSTLMPFVDDRVPAGLAFAKAMGFRVGIEMHMNELARESVDRKRIGELVRQALEHAEGYALESVPQPAPEGILADLSVAYELMSDAPRGDASWTDELWPPDRIRDHERLLAAQRRARWTLLARHLKSGEVAGFTEISFLPEAPGIVQQHGTAVARAHRGRRLGLLLKSHMLDRLLRDLGGWRLVRTGNADSNAPMLAINRALGFRPAFAARVLQAEVHEVAAALGA